MAAAMLDLLTRRKFCGCLAAGLALTGAPVRAAPKALWQPAEPTHRSFMARAIALAHSGAQRGDGGPYGAVIVKAGTIVGEGWNKVARKRDPTAHAEIEAIQDAARRLGTRSLAGCVLYTNGGRPCPMCETASYWANVDAIHYAHSADDITSPGAPKYGGC